MTHSAPPTPLAPPEGRRLTRRTVLSAGAALAAGASLLRPMQSWALSTLETGGLRIDSLSDGHIEFAADFAWQAIPEGDRAALLGPLGMPLAGVVESPLNVTLLRHDGRVVLFDAGSGPDFVPTAGRLADALAALDLAPEDVTDIVFTHAHPDHLWGVLDDFDEPAFAHAALHMGAAELAFWSDPATTATLPEDQQAFGAGAARRLAALDGQIATFGNGDTVLPGVVAVATPGHTPGHMSFAIGTPGAGLFVTGDFVTSTVSMARPHIGASTDHDPQQAHATRAAMLARLADEGWTILGYHLPGGGIGRVARAGDGFTFQQEDAT